MRLALFFLTRVVAAVPAEAFMLAALALASWEGA